MDSFKDERAVDSLDARASFSICAPIFKRSFSRRSGATGFPFSFSRTSARLHFFVQHLAFVAKTS
jgi:hypothetical protein